MRNSCAYCRREIPDGSRRAVARGDEHFCSRRHRELEDERREACRKLEELKKTRGG